MAQKFKLLVYSVKDLAAAKKIYTTLLGVEPYADAAYYVGYRVDDQEIGLDPNGPQMTGPIAYVEVADVKASLQALVKAGAQVVQDTKDVGGGKLIATAKDAGGNILGLMQMP